MAITHEEVIRYSNEVVRPMCESIRAIKAEIDSSVVTWFGTISTNCPNDAGEILEDGRAVDGVSVITGADINNVITIMVNLQTALDAIGVEGIISKPCVRPLDAE